MSLELLSPAGSLEKLKFAAVYGADALYAGAPGFSLRNKAESFSPEDFAEGLAFVHDRGKKLYLAANIFFHNEDLEPFRSYLTEVAPLGFDGVILSDLGMIDHVRETYPDLAVHVSTQANTTNRAAAKVYQRMGVKRLVLARELTLAEIRQVRDAVDLELEAFVHGAMCIAYSGRCLLSNYFSSELGRKGGVRDANRGDCTQVCRWEMALTEESRPGEYFPVEEDEFGTSILSSRDLNMVMHLDDLAAAGVTSFKIEGRMKSAWYAAATTRAYRGALDRVAAGLPPDPVWAEELDRLSHRGQTTGFYYQRGREADPTGALGGYPLRNGTQDQTMMALVDGAEGRSLRGRATNPLRVGDRYTVLSPRGPGGEVTVAEVRVAGERRDLVRPTEAFDLTAADALPEGLGPYSILLA